MEALFFVSFTTSLYVIGYICNMNLRVIIFVCFLGVNALKAVSQENTVPRDSLKIIDEHYREDQFYAAITYNLLSKKPGDLSQSGFSSGYHIGFIRDMPFNERRNLAVGIGLGLSSNSYNQSLLITESDGVLSYNLLDENEINYSKNKFTTYLVEMPFEFRWRTSTPAEYDFWRIYTGFKLGYIVFNSSKFVGDTGKIRLYNIEDVNRFQYGLTLSAGYSTISFQIYYGLNSLFNNSAKVDDKPIDLTAIKMGLMFYIL